MKKIFKIAAVAVAVLALAAISSLTATAHAQIGPCTWIATTFTGQDPFYGFNTVYAYTTGTTATLQVTVHNSFFGAPPTVTFTYYNLAMDWGQNYTGTISVAVPYGQTVMFTITFTVPATSTASNLVTHAGTLYLNYTTSTGTNSQTSDSVPAMAIYTSDQAAAMSLRQQVIFLQLSGCGSGNFKSSQAYVDCAQATQQFSLGQNAYAGGNFGAAKTDFQNAVNDWNNALFTETNAGGGLELASSVGTLLLGVGAAIGAVAVMIYVIRRPKAASAVSASH